jgi:hypothetical protein
MGFNGEDSRHDAARYKPRRRREEPRPQSGFIMQPSPQQHAASQLAVFAPAQAAPSTIEREILLDHNQIASVMKNLNQLLAPLDITISLKPKLSVADRKSAPSNLVTVRLIGRDKREHPKLYISMNDEVYMRLCAAWDYSPLPKLSKAAKERWPTIKAETPLYQATQTLGR